MDLLTNRRFANASEFELIALATDEGYDSLAYALACRLERNLSPEESGQLDKLEDENSELSSEISDLEFKVCELEQELANMADNEQRLRELVSRASKAVNNGLALFKED
ncbi:hypothetical protein [Psychrobacter sanguinis]|uniref:hypothetical protein n=1 Tax=Psychrobacter sanguinis TaxID=861445 RepID=UPI002A7639EE|nr:hypothetical protein [Psychrobacter sanguinis]MDY3306643.1 hypothetical protein [Psychrobacter sanguinis]